MKYSVSWINELAGTNFSAKEMADIFTRHSFEVDGIETISGVPEGVFSAKILDVSPHPNADRLSVVRVALDTEKEVTLSLVCGAKNIASGDIVPVATVGTILRKDVVIQQSVIRGVKSEGMICAEDELGLGENHEGVMHLPADTPIGIPLSKMFPKEEIIDLDILASRGRDALSHRGIARELRATLQKKNDEKIVKNKEEKKEGLSFPKKVEKGYSVHVFVEDTKKCKRYIGVLLETVNNRVETPLWMKERLRLCGMRSVNIVTDITNYVMLETGQPLHAFDAKKLISDDQRVFLNVRNAKKEETLTLLDGENIHLHKEDIVIADAKQVLALAGVMGGRDSGTNEETTSVFLEAAWFDPVCIRKTRIRHKLSTESAYRFERNVDPNGAEDAIVRAIELFQEFTDSQVIDGVDYNPSPESYRTIAVHPKVICRLLGVNITTQTMMAILHGLELHAIEKEEMIIVSIPTFRKDLLDSADIAEEIGRIYGYDRINSQVLSADIRSIPLNSPRISIRNIREILFGSGFDEMLTYSFYSKDVATIFGLKKDQHFEIENPMNPNQQFFRTMLLPNILSLAGENIRRCTALRLFEIGNGYVREENGKVRESNRLAIVITAKDKECSLGNRLREMKGVLELLSEGVACGEVLFGEIDSENVPMWLHPTRVSSIIFQNTHIGMLGVVHPKLAKQYKLPEWTIVAECLLENLIEIKDGTKKYHPIPKFPEGFRDISFNIPRGIVARDIDLAIRKFGGEYLRSIELLDVYEEKEIRSMTYRLLFGSDDRTLSGEEVEEAMNYLVESVETETGARVKNLSEISKK